PCSRNVENRHDLFRVEGDRENERERERELLLPDNIYSPCGSMARPVTASM
uniref:Uncharacterized protein n=1 Tax=Amphimedon queenslandica TaxID=400682 RepID=A0A1X7TM31_AMPQE